MSRIFLRVGALRFMKVAFEPFTSFPWDLRHQVSVNKVCLATGTVVYLCDRGVSPEGALLIGLTVLLITGSCVLGIAIPLAIEAHQSLGSKAFVQLFMALLTSW